MCLLDRIYEMTNEIYLSDLRMPEKLLFNIDMIRNIPNDKYSADDWQYVYSYIAGQPSYCVNVGQIKEALVGYAKGQALNSVIK